MSDFGGGDNVPAAALVATEDEDKAADAIAKAAKSDDGKTASYRGHDYYAIDDGAAGVVDGWVVIGSLSGFKDAIDTAEGGRPLEDDETFQQTLADAPEERLGFVYVNTPALVDNLKKSSPAASLGPFADILKDPVLATLDVNEHGARLETVLPASLGSSFLLGEGSGGAADLPADAWLGFAQQDLGATIDQLLTSIGSAAGGRGMIERQLEAATGLDLDKDVIAWMGDWSLFVRGTSVAELDGALVVESKDEAASKRFIEAIERLVRKSVGDDEHVGPLQVTGRRRGRDLPHARDPEADPPVPARRQGRARLRRRRCGRRARPREQARRHPGVQGRPGRARRRLRPVLLRGGRADPRPGRLDGRRRRRGLDWSVKPYLEPLGALVVGAKKEGDKLRAAFGITVK